MSEAKGLLSNTLHYDNLQSIITGLQTGGKVNKAIARELMMQATLDSYMHKIANTYPLYTDCFQPHINGVKLVSTLTFCFIFTIHCQGLVLNFEHLSVLSSSCVFESNQYLLGATQSSACVNIQVI